MPALLLHLTLAKELTSRNDAPPLLQRAAVQEQGAFMLGAILPDLPYHAHFGRQMMRHLLRHPYLQTEWGDIFHFRGTGQLALALLSHAKRQQLSGAACDKVLALAAGYLSHYAIDKFSHPIINLLTAKLSPSTNEPQPILHNRLERYQSLLYHWDRFHHDISGTSYARKIIGQVAGANLFHPTLEESLWQPLRIALLETHAHTPSIPQVKDWLWGIAAYGHVMASPMGLLERLPEDQTELRSTYFQGPGVDLLSPLHMALSWTIKSWQAAVDVIEAESIRPEVRATFLQRIPDIDLATGV